MKESINNKFNHFKIHTQYSICEGAIKIDQLKDFCKKNKIRSLGMSDTYNLSGALEFSENLSSRILFNSLGDIFSGVCEDMFFFELNLGIQDFMIKDNISERCFTTRFCFRQ